MQTAITFRNLDATEAIKAYARAKVERAEKYVDKKCEAHVVLALEKHQHLAEITLHTGTFFLHGRERSEDMYASIDLAMDKIERQLKRFKEKLKSHRHLPHHGEGGAVRVRHDVFAPFEGEESSGPRRIIRTDEFHAKPMTVEEAVLQMDLVENDFFVFQNAGSREVNVVFRRKDGNYGLIEARTR
jgi:putative sigma-54 modulation protein